MPGIMSHSDSILFLKEYNTSAEKCNTHVESSSVFTFVIFTFKSNHSVLLSWETKNPGLESKSLRDTFQARVMRSTLGKCTTLNWFMDLTSRRLLSRCVLSWEYDHTKITIVYNLPLKWLISPPMPDPLLMKTPSFSIRDLESSYGASQIECPWWWLPSSDN